MRKKSLLLLILCVAVLTRLPGLFWGAGVGGEHYVYNPDEGKGFRIAKDFLSLDADPGEWYVKGVGTQLGLVGIPVKLLGVDLRALYVLARGISLLYGLALVVLMYFLASRLFDSDKAGLLAAAFTAIADPLVTINHYGTVNSSLVFWFYFCLFAALMAVRSGNLWWLIGSSLAAGFAGALKFAAEQVFAVGYTVSKSKERLLWGVIALAFITVGFVLLNHFSYTPQNFKEFLEFSRTGLKDIAPTNKAWLNPLLYLFATIAGVGLPLFFVACAGALWFLMDRGVADKKHVFWIVLVPGMLMFMKLSLGSSLHERHVTIFVPLLVLFAAYACVRVGQAFRGRRWVNVVSLGLLLLYTLGLTAFTQYGFLVDTRELATQWLVENVGGQEVIGIGPAVFGLPEPLRFEVGGYNATYVVVHGMDYRPAGKMLPYGFEPYPPSCDLAFQCLHRVKYAQDTSARREFEFMRSLLLETGPYELVADFQVVHPFPERVLYRNFFDVYPFLLGDTRVYRK